MHFSKWSRRTSGVHIVPFGVESPHFGLGDAHLAARLRVYCRAPMMAPKAVNWTVW